MRQGVRIALSLGMALVGVLVLAPFARANLEGDVAPGKIEEVFAVPVPGSDDRVELWPLFLFEVAGEQVHVSYAGSGLGNHLYQPIPRPVLSRDDYERVAAAMRSAPRQRVFYRANDPSGTAFILTNTGPGPPRRVIIGALLLVVGLFGLLFGSRRREE